MECPKCKSDNPDDSVFCAKCGTQISESEEKPLPTQTIEAPREELTRGTTFADRYEIIEELGKGGMGRVYRVEDKKLDQEVALKLIKPEIAKDKKTIERFRNELKLARKIRHANVCGMFDLGETEDAHFITMEYIRGEDLKSFIHRSGQLAVGTSIRIAKQVCEGLSEAHKKGVVHRDLKSNNIMIDKDGNVRVMDFGIARSLEAKGITGAGVMIGTPEYMSPEQVEGKEVDQRSDLYSLGIILYEMVTGRVPFEGDTPFQIGVKHKSETPKDPNKLNTQIPGDLNRVILRCLEKEKGNRYQSVAELHSELTKLEEGIPTTERDLPRKKPLTSKEITVTFGMKKIVVPALIVLILVVVAIVIWQILPKKAAIPIETDRPSLAILYFENNTGDEELGYLRTGLAEWFITDLSQSKYIRVLSGDRIYSILKKLNILESKRYSSEDLKGIADQGRVNHILKGGYIKIGDSFIITAMLQNPNKDEIIRSLEARCEDIEEIPSRVDEITREIKKALKLSPEQISSDIDKTVGKITTSSPEAYKYYVQARKYLGKGEYREKVIPLLEKALENDPEFAEAHWLMAAAYGNMGYYSKSRPYLQKAFQLKDRVSIRERYRIMGTYYGDSRDTYPEAIEAYTKLLELYPDDETGNNMLGNIYANLGEWDEAIELYKVNVENKASSAVFYGNLSWVYMQKGLYDKAIEVLQNYQTEFGGNANIHQDLAWAFLGQGELDLAFSEADKAYQFSPTNSDSSLLKAEIYLYKGEFQKAENAYRELLDKDVPAIRRAMLGLALLYQTQGKFEKSKSQLKQLIAYTEEVEEWGAKAYAHNQLGWLYVYLGNLEQALKEFEASITIANEKKLSGWQKWNDYVKGYVYSLMKSMDKAAVHAEKFKEFITQGMNRREIKDYDYLIGFIELERENFTKAIECFNRGLSLESFGINNQPVWVLSPLAKAYYEAGQLDMAKETYNKIGSLTSSRLDNGAVYVKSFYEFGKIHEELGEKAEAIERYEKFLDLWKDADPGITEVDDARKRLAGLKD